MTSGTGIEGERMPIRKSIVAGQIALLGLGIFPFLAFLATLETKSFRFLVFRSTARHVSYSLNCVFYRYNPLVFCCEV